LKKLWFIVPLLLVGSLLVACGGSDNGSSTPSVADGVTDVVRDLLAEASPDTAPGQTLELTRVIIPAGKGIDPHTHPGPQLAIIVSGTLSYTVIDGEAEVTRAAATDNEKVEMHTSGDSFKLNAGDAIYEHTLMVHKASNDTKDPVVIYLSSLFPEGEPAASPAP
jgi:quercetin dioxygenase-like cupin family protein